MHTHHNTILCISTADSTVCVHSDLMLMYQTDLSWAIIQQHNCSSRTFSFC